VILIVQAIINITDHANMVLNVLKAKYGLRDKSETINLMVEQYEQELLQPELRPEFIEKMKQRAKEPIVKIGTIENFRERYNLS